MRTDSRAGKFVTQPTGYAAFVPANLPPDPPVKIDGELARLLSMADLALGRLDGITAILPNPDLFVAMYVKQEAVLSSQIEGTQASLTDVLQFEVSKAVENPKDVEEVVNYVAAMNYGLEQTALPLSLRLIRQIHGRLMQGVRGDHCEPGEFRKAQNCIGSIMNGLANATFVPPPPHILSDLLGNFEQFLHDESLPPLIHAGLAHAQFETIHPFLDGNGRMGRLLITFLLCQRGILARPLLYLSYYLKQNRTEYYDHLQAIRTQGKWEEWLAFFLQGVAEVAKEAYTTARSILGLRTRHEELLKQEGKATAILLRALDVMFEQPILTPSILEKKLNVSYVTANSHVSRLCDLGLLEEMTGYKRNRRFIFKPYLALFKDSRADPTRSALSIQSIDPDQVESPDVPHRTLTPTQIRRLDAIEKIFSEVFTQSREEWFADFAQEHDPDREIEIWEAMAKAYSTFCSRHSVRLEARKEAFSLLLQRSWTTDEIVLGQSSPQHLTPVNVRALLQYYMAPPRPIRVFLDSGDERKSD